MSELDGVVRAFAQSGARVSDDAFGELIAHLRVVPPVQAAAMLEGLDAVVLRGLAPLDNQGSALLSHPALAELYPPARRIVVPERLTVCGGPSLPAALVHIAGEAQRVATKP